MRLTKFTDFGLRLLMRMASEPQRAFSSTELATELGLSRHHVAKICQRLAAAQILATRSGNGGGAQLAKPAEDIRLGAIVRLLETGHVLVDCFTQGGGNCTLRSDCRLKCRLQRAEETFLTELDRSTLADVALTPAAPVAA